MRYFLVLLSALSFSAPVRADFIWDASAFYFSDTFTLDTDATNGVTLWATSLNTSIAKSKNFFFGWSILGVAHTQDPGTGTAATYSSTEMGPRLLYINKSGAGHVAVAYHLRNTTTYDSGSGSAANFYGTAIFAEIGYLPEWSGDLRIGLKLNYYAATFAESVVDGTTYSQISYAKNLITPALALSLRW